MEMFGGKIVVGSTEFVEGTIIEFRNGRLVAREYFKGENDEMDVQPGDYELDFVEISKKKTDTEKIQEIAKQIGYDEFYISADVVAIL